MTLTQIREEMPEAYSLETEYFLTNKDSLHLTVKEEETPLEKSRIYGPFPADVLFWMMKMVSEFEVNAQIENFTLSIDADGREYLEY